MFRGEVLRPQWICLTVQHLRLFFNHRIPDKAAIRLFFFVLCVCLCARESNWQFVFFLYLNSLSWDVISKMKILIIILGLNLKKDCRSWTTTVVANCKTSLQITTSIYWFDNFGLFLLCHTVWPSAVNRPNLTLKTASYKTFFFSRNFQSFFCERALT